MPPARLAPAGDDFIMNMKRLQYSQREIARKLGVSEGTIRYRIKRKQSGREDRRHCKASSFDHFRPIIRQWIAEYKESRRRPTLKTLYKWLREPGSG